MTGGLNGAVQQMILRCVLNDETIVVKIIDGVTHSRHLIGDIQSLFP